MHCLQCFRADSALYAACFLGNFRVKGCYDALGGAMKSDATCLKRKADGNAGIQRFGVNTVEHPHQSLNREGCRGTIDDFATSFLHFSLFSTALWDLPISRPVHSLMLSSYLFPCLPCLLPPFIVPCKGGGWSDLMNGKLVHTTAVCISLRLSGGLRVVQLPAGSWHGIPRW